MAAVRKGAAANGLQVRVERGALLAELALIKEVIERKNTIPVLAKVRIESAWGRLRLRGTDLDVTLDTEVDATVDAPGVALVDARKLTEVIKAMGDGEVTISRLPNDWIEVSGGRSQFKLPSVAAEDYPASPTDLVFARSLDAATLVRAVDRVAFAITQQESRYTLSGAQMRLAGGECRFAATDGHRLAVYDFAVPEGDGARDVTALVPKKALSAIRKLAADTEGVVAFAENENHLEFRFGERRVLAARKLSGAFPQYEAVIPKENDGEAALDRPRTTAALARVGVVADERSKAVRVTVASGVLTLFAQTTEVGEAAEALEVTGGDKTITFGCNAYYMTDALAACGGESVRLRYKDAGTQLMFEPSAPDDRFFCVVMPLRL